MKKWLWLTVLLLCSLGVCFAEENEVVSSTSWMTFITKEEPAYRVVKDTYTLSCYQGESVATPLSLNLETGDAVEVAFTVPEDGLYEIWLTYRTATQSILPTELDIAIDGQCIFGELHSVQLRALWVDEGVFPVDRYGNEMSVFPYAAEVDLEAGLCDSTARTLEPFLFELTAGEHVLSMTVVDGAVSISELSLRAAEETPAYVAGDASGSNLIVIEAEQIASRNSSSIRGAGEYVTTLSPYSSEHRKINHLAGGSFRTAGDVVTYEFEVAEGGWYCFGAYYRQNTREDYPVYLDILIDGRLPSDKASAVPFDYCVDFDYMMAMADGQAQTFYLGEGVHTLSLRINATPLTPALELIESLNSQINAMSQEIIRLSGGVTTDKYRFYNIQNSIPDIVDIFEGWASECDAMLEYLQGLEPNAGTSAFAYFQLSADQLRRLAEYPEDIPRRTSELSTGSNSVSKMLAQQMLDIMYNNVSIDQIYLYQTEAELPEKPGFMASLGMNVERFFNSFSSQDYSTSSGQEGHLQVWMSESRQLVELLQNLIDSEFTPSTGIEVDLAMMPGEQKLVLSNAAGTSPDVALSINFVTPSYLDVRGALYDLTEFEDFPEVADRFTTSLFVPYIYDEGVYSLPQTLLFWVMYYRTDIFESLEIEIPTTLDEVKAILPVLQANGMNFYYPTAGMSGTKSFAGTLPLIMQSGGSIYGATLGDTTLDSEESLEGFRTLTELFTIYSLPVDAGAGFYQRFRDGTLPIGIAELGMYNQLSNAAPELDGRWSIAVIPGVSTDGGNVSRWTTGNIKTCCILSNTDMPEEAWTFLKWWTSTEVQSTYANLQYTTYGEDYLWVSANKEAFSLLPIKASHKAVILEQMEWMSDAPWSLGTYMIERELSNAFISVVVDGVDARRALDKAVKRIDRETTRKLTEFGYIKDGEVVKEYITPNVAFIEQMISDYYAKKEKVE